MRRYPTRFWVYGIGAGGLVICTWAFIAYVVIVFYQIAPDAHFYVNDRYMIWNWPGILVKREQTPDGSWDYTDAPPLTYAGHDDLITRVGTVDGYVVGVAERGWFAINRASGEIYYPYENSHALTAISGVSFDESRVSASFPWELVRWKTGVWIVLVAAGLLCVMTLAACGMLLVRLFPPPE